jgi:hypothetical protein
MSILPISSFSQLAHLHLEDIGRQRIWGINMNNKTRSWTFALMALVPLTLNAQVNETPQGYSYVTYYVCDMATQGNMDRIVEANEYAVFDKWVEEGKLMSWGYLAHFTGGRWRRAQYHVSPTMADALKNQEDLVREIYADNRAGGQARSEACSAHDDYLWALQQGSPPGTDRGKVSLSIYFSCSTADQSRADEIFAEVYAPGLNELQKDGKIRSWGWQSHVLGGEYRRLQTLTGDDFASVIAAQMESIQQVNEKHGSLGHEFAQICDSHTDYLWNIVHESP